MKQPFRQLALLVLVLGLAAPCLAQDPATSFDQLGKWIRIGDIVSVTDSAGHEQQARILDFSPASLRVLVGNRPRDFREADVQRITRREPDSLRNGALIGLAVGAGFGLLAVAMTDCNGCDPRVYPLVAGIYGGLGAGIGVGFDALVPGDEVLVYRATGQQTPVALAPIVGRGRHGVALSLRF